MSARAVISCHKSSDCVISPTPPLWHRSRLTGALTDGCMRIREPQVVVGSMSQQLQQLWHESVHGLIIQKLMAWAGSSRSGNGSGDGEVGGADIDPVQFGRRLHTLWSDVRRARAMCTLPAASSTGPL